MVSMLLVSPLINMTAYIILGFTSGWGYAALTFVVWLVILFFQDLMTKQTKVFKKRESEAGDERLKLVNDVVYGARTIKCYGWENHYLQKIIAARKVQEKHIFE